MHKHLTGRDGTRVSSRRKLLQKNLKICLRIICKIFRGLRILHENEFCGRCQTMRNSAKKKSVQTTKYDTIYRLSKFNYVWEIAKIHLIKLITIQGYTSFGLIIELRPLEIKGI